MWRILRREYDHWMDDQDDKRSCLDEMDRNERNELLA